MAAGNTIHSEPATAVSIEFGITGPNHLVASGCSAGLDALGLAMLLLDAGKATRALVVAVDLPLVPILLDNYSASGLLGNSPLLDPYSPSTSGFCPGEGAAAIALERGPGGPLLCTWFANNSDAADPFGIPKDGGNTIHLLRDAIRIAGHPPAVCPHATGTRIQARAETTFLTAAFPHNPPALHLLKPFLGHTIGASGLLESAILLRFLRMSSLPPNLSGTTGLPRMPAPHSISPTSPTSGPVFKLAHGMGGHNSLAAFSHRS